MSQVYLSVTILGVFDHPNDLIEEAAHIVYESAEPRAADLFGTMMHPGVLRVTFLSLNMHALKQLLCSLTYVGKD